MPQEEIDRVGPLTPSSSSRTRVIHSVGPRWVDERSSARACRAETLSSACGHRVRHGGGPPGRRPRSTSRTTSTSPGCAPPRARGCCATATRRRRSSRPSPAAGSSASTCDADEQRVTLGPLDSLSMPAGAWRSFTMSMRNRASRRHPAGASSSSSTVATDESTWSGHRMVVDGCPPRGTCWTPTVISRPPRSSGHRHRGRLTDRRIRVCGRTGGSRRDARHQRPSHSSRPCAPLPRGAHSWSSSPSWPRRVTASGTARRPGPPVRRSTARVLPPLQRVTRDLSMTVVVGLALRARATALSQLRGRPGGRRGRRGLPQVAPVGPREALLRYLETSVPSS